MANKPRTPPPPRQQGPRKRATVQPPGASGGGFGQRSALLSGVLVGGVIGVALLLFFLTRGSKSQPGNDTIKAPTAQFAAAGCTLKSVVPLPPTKGDHVPTPYHQDAPTETSKVKWNTDPPAAGGHYQLWAIWDFYSQPVNPLRIVHNEEHGGVVIWWGNKVTAATVAKLRAFYDESSVGMVGTPYPTLGDKIALTAWTGDPATYIVKGDHGIGHIAICPKYDAAAFRAFRTAYRGKGPEGVPLSADKPGSGPGG
jgi:Protein of unknown function (DUF3105)